MDIKPIICKRCGHAVGRSATSCPMCGKKTTDPLLRLGKRIDQLGASSRPVPKPEKVEPRKPVQPGKPKQSGQQRTKQAPKPSPATPKVEARSIPRQPKKKGCGCCSGCFTIIIGIVVILGFLIFNPGFIDLPPEIREVIDEIRHELLQEFNDIKGPQQDLNKQDPADIPAQLPPDKPDAPPAVNPRLVVNKEYKTKRGYLAGMKKEDLLRAIEYKKNGNGEALQAMRSEKLIGNIKAGMQVVVLGLDPQNRWVFVKSLTGDTRFYLQPEALVE